MVLNLYIEREYGAKRRNDVPASDNSGIIVWVVFPVDPIDISPQCRVLLGRMGAVAHVSDTSDRQGNTFHTYLEC